MWNKLAVLRFQNLTKLPTWRRKQLAQWLRDKAKEISGDVRQYDDRFRATFYGREA